MKNYYKYILTGGLFSLFVNLILPSFAVTFNEPRKVVLPQHTNAVYGSLFVRDTMYLNFISKNNVLGKVDAFLMEIGQRPLYFWDPDISTHHLQQQILNLYGTVNLSGSGTPMDNSDVFTVSSVKVPNGTFISEDMFFRTTEPEVNIRGNQAKLFMNYNRPLKVYFQVGGKVDSINATVHDLNLFKGHGLADPPKNYITTLMVRDFAVSVGNTLIPFPSPRMMLFNAPNTTVYRPKGTSTEFKLVSKETIANTQHYYGPWQLVQAASGVDENTTCGSMTNKCFKQKYGIDSVVPNKTPGGGAKTNDPQYDVSYYYDNETNEFTCADEIWPGSSAVSGQWYNPVLEGTNTCYDYQLIQLPKDDLGKPGVYDSNAAAYEFKVQELLKVKDGNVTLVEQNPLFRGGRLSTGGIGSVAISTSTGSSSVDWTIRPFSGVQTFYIDGRSVSASQDLIKLEEDVSYGDACFKLCNGKICDKSRAYVKRSREGGVPAVRGTSPQQPDPNPIVAPPYQSPDATYVTYTYTVGFCPKNSDNDAYTNDKYEINIKGENQAHLVTGLARPSGTVYKAPKVCVRRPVKCNVNQCSGGSGSARTYRFLSVNY